MRPVDQHRAAQKSVRVALLTVSDTRTDATDESGALSERLLREAGHEVIARMIVRDDPRAIHEEVVRLLAAANIVITNGGTGITERDSTFEAVSALIEKRLDGFGELFRALSFADIGAAAMMSRAVAGTALGGLVVALPGSPDAVRLALEKILLPELGHLASLAKRASPLATIPSHLDAAGTARMVDVGAKEPTVREATAQAVVTMTQEALRHIVDGSAPKGDVLSVARIAGVQAAKRTSELVPLCHAVALTSVVVDFAVDPTDSSLRITAHARATDRTGVEMEALVAVSIAALTVYDMLKSVDRTMTIRQACLLKKSGGRSGTYERG